MIYESINHAVLFYVPSNVSRVLDVGCGTGLMGREIKKITNCTVVGITHSEAEADLASKWLDQVLIYDLNDFCAPELNQFDCIICSHILEHLHQPQELLYRLKHFLSPKGIVIIALPNVLHWKQRMEFLKGHFKYTEGGIMDKTHFRFFDWQTSVDIVRDTDYEIILHKAAGNFPQPIFRRFFKSFSTWLDQMVTNFMPGLFGVQFIIVARFEGLKHE